MPDQFREWRDSNEDRNFPFADDVTRGGLPKGAFLDAMFYPIDMVGRLFLSSLDTATGTLTVSDAATGDLKGTAVLDATEQIVFRDDLLRLVGRMVKGPQFDFIAATLSFEATDTPFAPTVVFPQNQPGVRGFILPDGTLLTGDVVFEGRGGIVVTSEVVDGQEIITFDAVGVAEAPECADSLGDPVKCIDINQTNLGGLTISRVDNKIFIDSRNALDELCTSKNSLPDETGGLSPTKDDPCDPAAPGPPPGPFPPFVPPEPPCVAHGGKYFIATNSDSLNILPTSAPGADLSLAGLTVDGLSAALAQLPSRDLEGLRIEVRGYAP